MKYDTLPTIGIRPTIDGRRLGVRESLEDQTMNMAKAAAALIEAGIIDCCPNGLKVLANGTLTKKVTVKAAAFSESAKEKIEQAGGKAEVV